MKYKKLRKEKAKMSYIIAELGNTHDGSLGLAKQMIHAASECGVNAVKIQTHIFDAESLPNAPNPPYFKGESRKQYFERTAFTRDQYLELIATAQVECGVDFLSSPFSIEAVDFLDSMGMKIFKIPSGEVSNTPLLRHVAKTGKPVFLSSGMSSWAELDLAVETLRDNGCEKLTLLQCVSSYPCPAKDAGLNVMELMRKRYALDVGYSDHTMGLAIPLAAVTLGATVIEKHFTLSKKMYGSDAKNSMEPSEFASMVQGIRDIESAMSHKVDKDKIVEELAEMKHVFEKSIVSIRDIPAGTKIDETMIAVKKPGNGIPARMYDKVLGKVANVTIKENQLIESNQLVDF